MPYTTKGNCVYKKNTGTKVGRTKGNIKDYLAALYTNTNESVNQIKGGNADNLSIQDIADKHKVNASIIKRELEIGKKIEQEHANDLSKATEIAMDHLSEFPDYYTRLIKMEKQAEKDLTTESFKLIKRLLKEKLLSKSSCRCIRD